MYVRPLIPGQANTRSNYTPHGHYSFLDKYRDSATLAGLVDAVALPVAAVALPLPNAREQRDNRKKRQRQASQESRTQGSAVACSPAGGWARGICQGRALLHASLPF